MALFVAYDQKVEVNGETVLSVMDGLGTFKDTAIRMLNESGIENPTPGKWYLQQKWLNFFKALSGKIGPSSLKLVGEAIPNNAKWPPMVNSIETALNSINVAYHMNHRNGEIGDYSYEKAGDRKAIIICSNPYPDAFDQGIIESAAKKFSKPNERASVKIDATKETRTKGGNTTTYLVNW